MDVKQARSFAFKDRTRADQSMANAGSDDWNDGNGDGSGAESQHNASNQHHNHHRLNAQYALRNGHSFSSGHARQQPVTRYSDGQSR